MYAFTNEWYAVRRAKEGKDTIFLIKNTIPAKNVSRASFLAQRYVPPDELVSSRSNSKDYERQCLNLYREAFAYSYHIGYHTTPGVGLSGTPLNEAVVMMNYIIPEFKKQNDLQKVNLCILSDGESCQASYGRKYYDEYKDVSYVRPRRFDYNVVLRDRQTGRIYAPASGWGQTTNMFIKQLRDRNSGVNVLGFRIMGGSGLSGFVSSYADIAHYDKVQKQWKKEKSAIIPFLRATLLCM